MIPLGIQLVMLIALTSQPLPVWLVDSRFCYHFPWKALAAAKSLQSCPTLCDPIDSSPPGSPVLRFSRQEHWSRSPFPSPMHERKSESEVAQSCLTLCNPMDCSLPGSSIHGIFQARVLEWVAPEDKRKFHLSSSHPCFYPSWFSLQQIYQSYGLGSHSEAI